jgi:tRNA (guanine-N7-)-methyltransferase
LGLEKYDSILLRALQKLTATSRHNVFLLRGEAENLLEYFDANEVGRIYLNFSDPWPRKGSMRKRLTHNIFLDKYRHILIPTGEIHIKTDNRAFFEFTLQHINEYGMKIDCVNLDLHAREPEGNIRTEYETSRAAAGSTIYRLVCRFP